MTFDLLTSKSIEVLYKSPPTYRSKLRNIDLSVMIKVIVTLIFDLLARKSIGVFYESPPTSTSSLRTTDPIVL